MPTRKIIFPSYPPDRFGRLSNALASRSLKLVGNDGEVKEFGAEVQYSYSPGTQTLVMTVLHGPHMHSFDDFCAQLKAAVEAQA